MSKMDVYASGRLDGMVIAYNDVKEGGIEELEKDIKFRKASGVNIALSKKELGKATEPIKAMTLDTVLALTVATLRDEFGFGQIRLERFIERFNLKADCIMSDMATWGDYVKAIDEEVGIKLKIRYND